MLGGRYDIFRRTSHNNPVNNGVETEGPLLERDAEAFTGRVGLVVQPVPTVDLYGSFANSFRPLTQAQPDGTTLEPEKGRQIEFGQRFHMAGGRVQLNTAIFHIVRENVAFSRPGACSTSRRDDVEGFRIRHLTSPVSNWRITGPTATPRTLRRLSRERDDALQRKLNSHAPSNLLIGGDTGRTVRDNVGARAQARCSSTTPTHDFRGYGALNRARYRAPRRVDVR